MLRAAALFAALLLFSVPAAAQNKPCSGKKGGISHCEGEVFVCNDGSASASKRSCPAYLGSSRQAPPAPRPAATENSSSLGPQILGGIVIGGILLFAWVMQQDGKQASRTASASHGEVRYTGKMRIDSGTEYVALEEPSYIGGACDGWNAVEIRKPGATRGIKSQLCWRRDGAMMLVTSGAGAEITPSHYGVWRE